MISKIFVSSYIIYTVTILEGYINPDSVPFSHAIELQSLGIIHTDSKPKSWTNIYAIIVVLKMYECSNHIQ